MIAQGKEDSCPYVRRAAKRQMLLMRRQALERERAEADRLSGRQVDVRKVRVAAPPEPSIWPDEEETQAGSRTARSKGKGKVLSRMGSAGSKAAVSRVPSAGAASGAPGAEAGLKDDAPEWAKDLSTADNMHLIAEKYEEEARMTLEDERRAKRVK